MATLTFAELQTEFFSRGFDQLNDASTGLARAKRYINEAYADVCDRQEWPFLYADATGAPPLTISALRAVLSVTDSTNDTPLSRIDRRTLVEMYPDLPDTGTPTYWYRNSETSLAVYPANTGVSLSVRYVKFPTVLSGSSDSHIIPERWQDLILDGAVVRAKKGRDDYDSLNALYEQGIAKMAASYGFSGLDGPDQQVVYDDLWNC